MAPVYLKQPSNIKFQIMLEEDREKVMRAVEAVMSNGKDGFTEFRWAAKDNRIVSVEADSLSTSLHERV